MIDLNGLPAVSIPDEKLDKRPGVPMTTLSAPAALEQFIATIEWVLERREALAGKPTDASGE